MKPAHRGENCKSFEWPLEANSQRIQSLYLFYLTFISTFTRETCFRHYNEITIKESNNKTALGGTAPYLFVHYFPLTIKYLCAQIQIHSEMHLANKAC